MPSGGGYTLGPVTSEMDFQVAYPNVQAFENYFCISGGRYACLAICFITLGTKLTTRCIET